MMLQRKQNWPRLFVVSLIVLVGMVALLSLANISARKTEHLPTSTMQVPAVAALHRDALPIESTLVIKDQQGNLLPKSSSLITSEKPANTGKTYRFDLERIAHLRATKNGDPRTPPLLLTPRRSVSIADSLGGDSDAYLARESHQKQRAYIAMIRSSDTKIAEINAAIEMAKQQGISEAEQAIAKEKIRLIKAMQVKLRAKLTEMIDYPVN